MPGNFQIVAELTSGPDGNLWFTEPEDGTTWGEQPALGEITPAGVTTLHAMPQGTTLDPNRGVAVDTNADHDRSRRRTLVHGKLSDRSNHDRRNDPAVSCQHAGLDALRRSSAGRGRCTCGSHSQAYDSNGHGLFFNRSDHDCRHDHYVRAFTGNLPPRTSRRDRNGDVWFTENFFNRNYSEIHGMPSVGSRRTARSRHSYVPNQEDRSKRDGVGVIALRPGRQPLVHR